MLRICQVYKSRLRILSSFTSLLDEEYLKNTDISFPLSMYNGRDANIEAISPIVIVDYAVRNGFLFVFLNLAITGNNNTAA